MGIKMSFFEGREHGRRTEAGSAEIKGVAAPFFDGISTPPPLPRQTPKFK
jgi:hypothetical protein